MALTFIFRDLKLFVVFSHQNPQNLFWNPSFEKKFFFEKKTMDGFQIQFCGFWWENATNIFKLLKIKVKCLR